MANPASIKMVGDWRKEIGVPLRDALAVSMDVIGRTGAEACKHAIILMAQSARALTPKSKKKRPVMRDMALNGAEYIEVYKKDGTKSRIHKFRFNAIEQSKSGALQGSWEDARNIANSGLAKKSWMWGLKGLLAAASVGKPIHGVTTLRTILGQNSSGYILTDKMSYLMKILPAGWEQSVATSAGNKIMAQARNKIERDWKREMNHARRGGLMAGRGLSQYFLRAG